MKRVGHFKSKIIVIVGVPMHRLPCRKFLCGQMQWRKGFLVAIGCQSTVQFPDVLWKHSLYGPGCKKIHLSDVYKRLYRRMTASKTWLMNSNLSFRHKRGHWQGVENFNTFWIARRKLPVILGRVERGDPDIYNVCCLYILLIINP